MSFSQGGYGAGPPGFPHLEATLQSVYGYSAFRPLQREVIMAVSFRNPAYLLLRYPNLPLPPRPHPHSRPHPKTLTGRDADVLMATGSGKSLTFQVPVLHARRRLGRPKATTFVVSPLVSLMEDQVQALHSLGVSACSLQSGCSHLTYSRALRGEFALVYVTRKFRAKREITLFARGMKLTRPCSHAPVAALLPARVGQRSVS